MKRQDIISKLMIEGFTQKTLVNLSDKQLHMLAERVLSEQYGITTSTTPSVLNIPKEKTQDIASAKTRKQTFATYENEMKEQQLGSEKKEKTEKEKTLQKINHKIEMKMKKGECIKDEVELLKRMDKNMPEKFKKYIESRTEKTKKEPAFVNENKKMIFWVNKIVENKYFTSKNEIMDLIQVKLNEQKIEPRPANPEKEVETEPDKRTGHPDYDPDKDNPFKVQPGIKIDPKATTEPEVKPIVEPDIKTNNEPDLDNPYKVTPDIKINPKAKNELSVQDAKNKIIDLMIKNL